MLTLYYAPGTRAFFCRWLLEEAELPYEVVRLERNDRGYGDAAYRHIHPHGRVPALVDDGQALHESAAICIYIADKVPEKRLAPPVGTAARGLYYQWIVYAAVTAGAPLGRVVLHTAMLPPDRRMNDSAERGRRAWREVAEILSAAVTGRDFIVGDHLTAADVMIGGTLLGAAGAGLLVGAPELDRYVSGLSQRAGFQRALVS
jgi:glutathione S-transferase